MNLRNIFSILTVLVINVLLSGCITLYKPAAVHSPMLEQKGDGHVTGSLGLSGSGLTNIQAAYAVSDHVGIMADGMFHYRTSDYNDYYGSGSEDLRIYSGGGGIGYFEKFGKSQRQLINVYGGGGYGTSDANILYVDDPDPRVKAEFGYVFIQPGIIFSGEYVDMGLDVRMNYVRLYNIHAYLYDQFDWWNTSYQFASDSTLEFMLAEPNFTITAGGKHLKGILQAGLTIPVVNSDGYYATNSVSLLTSPILKFNIGISYTFGRKEKPVLVQP